MKKLPTNIQGKLRARRFLRHPLTVCVSYLLLLACACWFGSRTIWQRYDILQAPSLLLGLCSSVGAVFVGLSVIRIAQWSMPSRKGIDQWRITQFRHGVPTSVFACMAVLFGAAGHLAGPAPDLLTRVFKQAETSREGLDVVRDQIKILRNQPRYESSQELDVLEKVINYWSASGSTQMSREKYLQQANSFLVFIDVPNIQIQSWTMIMAADAFDRAGRKTDAVVYYSKVAQMPDASKFLVRWASLELGNYSYTNLKDTEAAISFWKAAIDIKPTSGLLNNLALALADDSNWEAAEKMYIDAEKLLIKEASNPANPRRPLRWAVLYANWANCIRRRMASEGISDASNELYKKAVDLCDKAIKEMPCHLDAYWIRTRLAVVTGDWAAGGKAIDSAQKVVQNGECDLDRFSFDKIAAPMNLWLRCLLDFHQTRGNLSNELRSQLSVAFQGFSTAPYSSLHEFLLVVATTDLSIEEDMKILARMADDGFLDSVK